MARTEPDPGCDRCSRAFPRNRVKSRVNPADYHTIPLRHRVCDLSRPGLAPSRARQTRTPQRPSHLLNRERPSRTRHHARVSVEARAGSGHRETFRSFPVHRGADPDGPRHHRLPDRLRDCLGGVVIVETAAGFRPETGGDAALAATKVRCGPSPATSRTPRVSAGSARFSSGIGCGSVGEEPAERPASSDVPQRTSPRV